MKRLEAFAIVCITLLLLAVGGLWLANRPLGPALALGEAASAPAKVARASEGRSEHAPATQGQDKCGGAGVETILLLGEASPEDIPHRGADAIRLMKVDFDQEKVAIVSVPPDLWVQTPSLEKLLMPANTLTVLYWDIKTATQGSEKHKMVEATQAFAQALVDNWDYAPAHYVTVSQPRFAEMIDTLGGIDIHLDAELVDERFGVFPAGDLHLEGQRTLDFVRVLNPASGGEGGQWDRFARQNQALKAILAALLGAENWPKVPDLAKQFSDVVATDLSVKQMSDLICMVEKAGSAAVYAEIAPEMISVDEAGRQVADVEQVKALLELVSLP